MSKRYDAFISYSHSADGRFAPSLQEALQKLAKPWHRRKALEVFRDDTGLSVNPHLWTSISDALDGSEYFLLLASPEAADSVWVQREIEHWVDTKPTEKMLPVLTSGDWVWDEAANDFDWARSTAVSPALAGVFREEPRHLDLRWAGDEDQLDLRHSDFRDAVAQLAAPMHGMAKDELEGEDVRLHRRARRLARAAVLLLLLLFLTSTVAGIFALRNASDARESQRAAEASEVLATEEAARARSAEATAQEEAANARAAEQLAREETDRAQSAEEVASEQRDIAEAEEARAVAANARAEDEAANAIAQALIAAEQRDVAEAQTVIAGQERDRAEGQTALAEEQSALAARRAEEAAAAAADARASAEEAARQAAAALVAQAEAEAAADEAERQATLALASKLAADSLTAANAEDDDSIAQLLAAEAVATFLDGQAPATGGPSARAAIFDPTALPQLTSNLRAAILGAVAIAEGELAELRGHEQFIYEAVFSPGCRSLATVGSDGIVFTRPDTWRQVAAVEAIERVGMRFDAAGENLLFDIGDPIPVPAAARALPETCAGQTPASASDAGGGALTLVSPDGALQASVDRSFVYIHPIGTDPTFENAVAEYSAPFIGNLQADIYTIAWHGDSTRLAVGHETGVGSTRAGAVVQVRDVPVLGSETFHPDLDFPVLSENGRYYIDGVEAAAEPKTVLWDVVERRRIATAFDDHALEPYSVSNDGRYAIAHHETFGDPLELVDLRTGARRTLVVDGTPAFRGTAFSPDGSLVAIGSNTGRILLLESATGAVLADVEASNLSIDAVVVSDEIDGRRYLAGGGGSGVVHVFDVTTPDRPVSLGGQVALANDPLEVLDLAISPDNGLLAFAATGTSGGSGPFLLGEVGLVRLDRLTSSTRPSVDGSRYTIFSGLETVAFNSDGSLLALAGLGSELQIVDVERRFLIGRLFNAVTETRQVRFPVDGTNQMVISSFGGDQRVFLLDYSDESALNYLCIAAGRDLTPDELSRFVPAGTAFRRACDIVGG